jgi:hypothetical protein
MQIAYTLEAGAPHSTPHRQATGSSPGLHRWALAATASSRLLRDRDQPDQPVGDVPTTRNRQALSWRCLESGHSNWR